jgi:hypothetical protein
MASPLLGSIDARIAAAQDPIEVACLRAERAGLLARQGDIDEARTELAALHAQHDHAPHAVVSAWLHLGDGLVLHFTNQSAAARDRMMRSLALSTAVQARPVQALSAAWLAQIEYLGENFASCAKSLLFSFRVADDKHHSARSRACLVAAQCFHWADRLDRALSWYQRTRNHSTVEGDQATVGALMHNMTWLRVVQARHASVLGSSHRDEVRQILSGAESLGHFDSMTGMAPLASLVPVLRAHVLTLLERYTEARDLFIVYMETASAGGLQRLMGPALVDLAWCRANIGDLESALFDANTAEAGLSDSTHGDERAFIHGRLAQVYGTLGHVEKTSHHEKKAAAAWNAHAERQRQLFGLVDKVCADSNAR